MGELASGASGNIVLPLRLPATPADAATFPADSFGASAAIGADWPEPPATAGDNTGTDTVDVVRPNVYVTATGPDSTARLSWGSGFVYTLGYGNRYGAAPGLTRDAAGTVLTATLPADVTFLSATLQPTSVNGRVLVWDLGMLTANGSDTLRVAVRTNVPAGMCQALLDTSLGEMRCEPALHAQHLRLRLAVGAPGVKGPLRG